MYLSDIPDLQLIDLQTNRVAAETHSANLGIISTPRYMRIEVGPDLVPFLDIVVISFIICEKKRRERRQGARNMRQ